MLLVVLGDMLQQGITQNDQSVTGAAIVVVSLSLLSVLSAFLTYACGRCAVRWKASRSS